MLPPPLAAACKPRATPQGPAHLEQQVAQQLDGGLADAPVVAERAGLHGRQQQRQRGRREELHGGAPRGQRRVAHALRLVCQAVQHGWQDVAQVLLWKLSTTALA